jgi:signal transduction histidine kinase
MRLNPSLTARLRIGFAVLFALLLVVSLLGVGRLFQIRVDYEDDQTRFFQLELEAERMRSSFALEQAAVRTPTPSPAISGPQLAAAVATARGAADRARELAGDTGGATAVGSWVAAEARWRKLIARPLIGGRAPDPERRATLAQAVTAATDRIAEEARTERDRIREDARDDTRATTVLVAAGLVGSLLAALFLFSGLINSMRAPMSRLVDGARRLADGELETRVEVGGPIEISTLGRAFNEMASELEREARERNRVERMKDDFLLTVSHELRTPVTVVKGFAEMLTAQRNRLNGRQREAVRAIQESTGQLQTMIDDLLDLARSDAGRLRIEPKPTSARSLAQRAGRQMRPHFEEKDQSLTVSIERNVPRVMADPDRIGQVLANLLTNANKYAPEGAQVRLTAERVGEEVEFAVADDGPGLSEEALDQVFERFWRTEAGETQTVGGTGLGLAIAKSLVELHGGAISADSRLGRGATFRFVLPVAGDGRRRRGT